MTRLSKTGALLVVCYALFVAWALFVIDTNPTWALSSVFLIAAALPWSLLIDQIMANGSEQAAMALLLLSCAVNGVLIYGMGFLIGSLLRGARRGARDAS